MQLYKGKLAGVNKTHLRQLIEQHIHSFEHPELLQVATSLFQSCIKQLVNNVSEGLNTEGMSACLQGALSGLVPC